MTKIKRTNRNPILEKRNKCKHHTKHFAIIENVREAKVEEGQQKMTLESFGGWSVKVKGMN